MEHIKRLLEYGTIEEANASLMYALRDQTTVDRMMSTIVLDHEFWKDIIARHEFRIVADGTDMEQIIAPRYVNVMTASFFCDKINELDDVLRYSIHGGAHHKCIQLWKNCPVPMNTFNDDYLAWIEDIYGQRFVHLTAPHWHADMYITANYYFEFHGKQPTELQQDVINMLRSGQPIKSYLFSRMYDWLYVSDATNQQTFNWYMAAWAKLSTDPQTKQMLDQAFTM
jgi:hypothetical protein